MAAIKYTAARFALFAAFFGALWAVDLDIFVKMMIALVLSAITSFFLLRGWRDDVAHQLADRADRRRAEREKLRAALAGDDEAGAAPQPAVAKQPEQ